MLRRIWYAVPFLAVSLVGFVSLAGLLYEDVYNLDELQRGYLAAVVEPFQLLGLAVGARLGTRLFLRDPALIFRFLKWVAIICAVLAAGVRPGPHPVARRGRSTSCSPRSWPSCSPGVFATLSLAIPARARAVGFSVGVVVGDPRPGPAAVDRLDLGQLGHPGGHVGHDPDPVHRRPHDRVRWHGDPP